MYREHLVGSCKGEGGCKGEGVWQRWKLREKRKHGVTRAEGGRLPNKTKDMEEKLSKLL